MAEARLDRRTERTRQALLEAFIALIFERGYDAISVAAIIERANIGRSTFYEHYAGKEELLRQSVSDRFSGLAGLVDGGTPTPSLLALLEHFVEYGKLARALLNGPTRPLMARCLAELIEPRLASLLRRHPAAEPIIPVGMVAAQLAEAQLALVGHWLANRACGTDSLAAALAAGTRATLSSLLRLPPTGETARRHPDPSPAWREREGPGA